MKRTMALILAIVMPFAMTFAAGSTLQLKDTLSLAIEEEPILDPWLMALAPHLIVGRQIYDSLILKDPDGNYQPRLAEKWKYLDDIHMRLYLRQGVKFHDGNEFTSEDVMYFFKNIGINASAASRYAAFDIKNTKIVDKYTIDLALKYTYAETLDLMASMYIPSKTAIEKMGNAAFNNSPVGTGPYKLVRWDVGSEIELARFDDYWGGKATTKKILYKLIPEASSRVVELETGGVDIALTVGTANINRIKKTKGLSIVMGASPRYVLLTFSMKDKILSNKDVRYALAYAIDKQALVSACYEGYAYLMDTMYPAQLFGAKKVGVIPYDLPKAKELMAKAGYPNGFTVTLQVVGDEEKRVCEAVQSMWSKLGVKANIIQMTWINFEAAGNVYQAAVRTGAATNLSGCIIIYKKSFGRTLQVNDDYLDDMVNRSDTLIDSAERLKLVQKIQDYLYDIRYSVPIANTPMVYAVSDKVKGFEFDSFGAPFLQNVTVTK